jgi:hypothetical protein
MKSRTTTVAAPKGTAAPKKKASPAAPKATTTKKKTTTTATGKGRKTTAPRGTKSSGARQAPRVVVFPDRDKYHTPGCRFAGGRGSEKVTKATARRRGHEPCGVCKP